jgi:hypothetical protein
VSEERVRARNSMSDAVLACSSTQAELPPGFQPKNSTM